jgi:hypothetical protein
MLAMRIVQPLLPGTWLTARSAAAAPARGAGRRHLHGPAGA